MPVHVPTNKGIGIHTVETNKEYILCAGLCSKCPVYIIQLVNPHGLWSGRCY